MASWTDWKLNDILWGIIIPVIVGFLIIIFPTELRSIINDVDSSGILNSILVDGLGEALLTVGIPMFAGLVWNKWAGGGAGFMLGSIYALYVNDTFAALGAFDANTMMVGEISNLGYVVCAMLTGYIAGALNRDSFSFRRMVVAGLVAGIIGGMFLLWTQLISPFGMVTGDSLFTGDLTENSLFLNLLPRLIYGILVPLFATLFGWFGISPKQMG
ncbi:MAG: hypothetical protein NWF06_09340 [Candidatus Bathyarchaeota archaeon]|nr:hypothetical protein [Candidatus Bathyarchaeum sp.]